MMPIVLKLTAQEVLKGVISSTLKKINFDIFDIKRSEFDKIKSNFPDLYQNHFTEICNWAFSIPFIGLSRPKQTDLSTVELLIASDIVKRRNDKNIVKISEDSILNSNENILLVGAPGAGKTTTLKRLIINYLSNISNYERYGFPVLVRLRDVPPETTLFKYILDIFSIKYDDRIITNEVKTKRTNKNGEVTLTSKIVSKTVTYVGETPILLFITKFLNHTQALLLLDGLDEIEKSIQIETLRNIESLALKLNKSKILLTVRKSELNKLVDNFTTYDIAPLSNNQIAEIAEKWVNDSSSFLKELKDKPYKDLANRPIFLTLLMVLYDKQGYLPTQASEVYEDATYLIINEWDEHRDIVRHSKYADFNTRKKLKFLAEVSYYLTYKVKQKIFSSKDLEDIYFQICSKYGLPKQEMKQVVAEVESHTGIIVESKYKTFEFSHLSIQEFLCAKHLVNLPYSKETVEYFFEYPEPLAIAISISGEPSLWFANLLLNSSLNIHNFKKNQEARYSASAYTLLNRLLVENPPFRVAAELGFAFFYLVMNFYKTENFKPVIDEFFIYPSVRESISLALQGCKYKNIFNGFYLINRKAVYSTSYFIDVPVNIDMPSSYIESLEESKYITLKNGFIS